MPTFEHTIEIAAPVDYVFTWGSDPMNWQRSTPSLTDFDVVEETDDGFRMDATYRMLGRSLDGEMEFEIVDPDAHTVTRFESPGMTGELHYRYEEHDGRTTVVQSADYEFGDSILERVIEPVAKRYNKRQFENSLRTSKELIEAEYAAESDGDETEAEAETVAGGMR